MSVVTLPPVVAQAVAAISLGLLAASGVAKLVDPDPTTGAMRAARLPASDALSQILGMVEVVVSILALAIGGISLWLAALLYTGFAAFTFAALRQRIPLQSCGCFGREDTPPTAIHVAYNLVAAAGIFFLAVTTTLPVVWDEPLSVLLSYLALTAIGVYASYLLLTRLPQLLELVRSG